ncbi:MAG: exodeoxyribonuclease VII large subunit [Bacteroidales bacterium]|jgi:exodeoxyribonuclease VII large subunit|nr:exodeoxyribonuclease VII large subunit [Bacteroidales bacterium]
MNEKLSLTELQLVIKDSLYLALPDMYWVIAEISEIKENYNGHCYLELIEKHPDDINIRARVRAVIWNSRYRFLKTYFENSARESLREGLKILIKVKIEYHEIYGLSLVINDIDPAFTIGDMAIRRQQIIRRLEEEGVITMNRELEIPLVPQRIAVISSGTSAGYSDFIKHLKSNSFGYVFYTALFETPMQGKETESGVILSLEKIASHLDKFDVAVIIRGGGSQTDLSWFDSYPIAYYITQFPVPVITGIGHDKDLSVTDIVANASLKTPTAVADFLIDRMNEAASLISELSSGITDYAKVMLEETGKRLETAMVRLAPVTRIMISGFRELLSSVVIDMSRTGRDFLVKANAIPDNQKHRLSSGSGSLIVKKAIALKHKKEILSTISRNKTAVIHNRLTGFENSLKILDPENVLKRGYTITSIKGKIIKKGESLRKDDMIDTRFSDGTISSKVVKEVITFKIL